MVDVEAIRYSARGCAGKLFSSVYATLVAALVGSLRYGDYGQRTTAGRALSFVRSTGLSRANIER